RSQAVDDGEPIRLLIADDNSEFPSGLRGLLAAQHDLLVVGEAATGAAALLQAARTLPDVVLTDLQMPDLKRHRCDARARGSQSTHWGTGSHECSRTMSPSSRRCAPVHEAICSRVRAKPKRYGRSELLRAGRPFSAPGSRVAS